MTAWLLLELVLLVVGVATALAAAGAAFRAGLHDWFWRSLALLPVWAWLAWRVWLALPSSP